MNFHRLLEHEEKVTALGHQGAIGAVHELNSVYFFKTVMMQIFCPYITKLDT